MPSKSATLLKNLLLLLASIAISLVLIEAILRLADFPRQSIKFERVYDPILLYRFPGNYPGVNREGFRNSDVPSRVDVVTLGDSHTYGYNAAPEDTWPSQLSRMTGLSVYNMGIGGHAPLQYYYVLDRALQLKPRFIVIGLYLANDIKGICDLYLKTEYWKSGPKLEKLDLQYCNDAVPHHSGRRKNKFLKKTDLASRLSDSISDTKIGTLLDLGVRLGKSYFPFDTKSFIVLNDDKNRIYMVNKEVRNNRDYMDIKRPEIAKSLAVTKEVLSRMSRRAQKSGAKLVVLLVPSKSYVLDEYLKDKGRELPGIYEEAALNESMLGADISVWLGGQGIPFVDAKSEVVRALAEVGNIYPLDGDDHPVASGYKAYADALYKGYFAVLQH